MSSNIYSYKNYSAQIEVKKAENKFQTMEEHRKNIDEKGNDNQKLSRSMSDNCCSSLKENFAFISIKLLALGRELKKRRRRRRRHPMPQSNRASLIRQNNRPGCAF